VVWREWEVTHSAMVIREETFLAEDLMIIHDIYPFGHAFSENPLLVLKTIQKVAPDSCHL
jgi:hypothetical protein